MGADVEMKDDKKEKKEEGKEKKEEVKAPPRVVDILETVRVLCV